MMNLKEKSEKKYFLTKLQKETTFQSIKTVIMNDQ